MYNLGSGNSTITLAPKIPVSIIGGYLGAGKTTLLNYLLQSNHGLRIAVVVNDFGSINIDAELIQHKDGETINLTNGCICCSIVGNLATTLKRLVDSPKPLDHILIESSGVSEPQKVAQYAWGRSSYLDGIIVVADAETSRKRSRDKYVGDLVVRQLQAADFIVLSKLDLLGVTQQEEVRQWLRDLIPQAKIVEASYGQVPLNVLLGSGASQHLQSDHDYSPSGDYLEPPEDDPNQPFSTWSYTSHAALERKRLEEVLKTLPSSILRLKGILICPDAPSHRTILQLVGKRWTWELGKPWGAVPPMTQLVVIGLAGGLNGVDLQQMFANCETENQAHDFDHFRLIQ